MTTIQGTIDKLPPQRRQGADVATIDKTLLVEISEGIKKTQTAVTAIQGAIDKLPPQRRQGADVATVEQKLVDLQRAVSSIRQTTERIEAKMRPPPPPRR